MTATTVHETLNKLRRSDLCQEYGVTVEELAGFDLERAVKRERRRRSNYTRTLRQVEKEERAVARERDRQALCEQEDVTVFGFEVERLERRVFGVEYDRKNKLVRRLNELAAAAHELEHAKAVVEYLAR